MPPPASYPVCAGDGMGQESIDALKEKIRQSGFDEKFVSGLQARLDKDDPRIENRPVKDAEHYRLSRLANFLRGLRAEPEGEREKYIERKLLEFEYERKLYRMRGEADRLRPMQVDASIALFTRFVGVVHEAELKVPGFREMYGWDIYALQQFILGRRTAGSVGCLRLLDRDYKDFIPSFIAEADPNDPSPRDTVCLRMPGGTLVNEEAMNDEPLMHWIMQDENFHSMNLVPYDPVHVGTAEGLFSAVGYENLQENPFIPASVKKQILLPPCYSVWAAQQFCISAITGVPARALALFGSDSKVAGLFDEKAGKGSYARIMLQESAENDRLAELKEISQSGGPVDYGDAAERLEGEIKEMAPDPGYHSWLKKSLAKFNPQWGGLAEEKASFCSLAAARNFLKATRGKPRKKGELTVQMLLLDQHYDAQLRDIMKGAFSLPAGDKEACDKFRAELYMLLAEAGKALPDYKKDRALEISGLRGDILARRTGGRMGSTRMLISMQEGKNGG